MTAIDTAMFDELFARHSRPLTALVARMVDSPHVAAELVQDVFLKLWSARRELDVRGELQSYLRRAARNRALDWLRREDLHREWERTAAHEMALAGEEPRGAHDTVEELRALVAAALAAMPERRRAVCELRWREGLAPAAIGARLGVSIKTVETHITQGLKDLRAARGVERSPALVNDGDECR